MRAIVIGVGATLLMDVWNGFLARAFGIRSLDFCAIGRLLTRRHECVAGWTAHYTIGVVLAVAFGLIVTPAWLERPTLGPALAFGAITVVFPVLVLQPALGLGGARQRMKSLVTHLVYGGGLFLTAEVVRLMLQ